MRKKSGKKASEDFSKKIQKIKDFLEPKNLSGLSDAHQTWMYDYAIIRLYRDFEDLILNCLVASINQDTGQLSSTTNVDFPKHLTDEVCEYIIVGNGYFDFKGIDGLIGTLKKYIRDDHYLVKICKNPCYKDALGKLSALRNFAAHDSKSAKKRALKAIGAEKLASSGAWLKRQRRFDEILSSLTNFAEEISQHAPH